jgi:hypothetical protein
MSTTKLKSLRYKTLDNVIPDELNAEGNVVPGNSKHTGAKPPKKVRAQFGRKRSHNEQIFVAPCGDIIARETFFGAEAVSSVVVSHATS